MIDYLHIKHLFEIPIILIRVVVLVGVMPYRSRVVLVEIPLIHLKVAPAATLNGD